MDTPDSRTRKKIALNSRAVLSPSASARIFSEIVLPNLALVGSLWTAGEWLLSRDVPKSWVLLRTLACSALAHLAREAWAGNPAKVVSSTNASMLPAFGILSVSFLLQQTCLVIAISYISCTRVAAFVLFSLACAKALSTSSTFPRAIPVLAGIAWSLASDASYSVNTVRDALPGYLALAAHVPLTCAVEHFHAQLSIKLGSSTASAAGTLGATLLAMGSYALREASYTFKPHATVVPLTSLLAIPLLAYTAQPSSSTIQLSASMTPQIYTLSGILVVGASCVLSAIFGASKPTFIDLAMPALVLYGGLPAKSKSASGVPETPISLVLRSHLKTIMENPESRKIFYFLMLNISFMFVQMLYGVWTNSLGLISDAIHMGFDCMAIGVGLFASIMATWPPNERFTYGYGRIETLSGFANGIFLVLISTFIVFEAIQRLLDPPEMNTNQLLLISSMGLGVNLFGMFAMGGHHHHGHGHSHGHDHGHGHGHDHGHSHSHAHAHSHAPAAHTHAHDHAHNHSQEHAHNHEHDGKHEQGHAHEHGHAHDHGHEHEHKHEHGHAHEHAHEHEHEHHGHIHGESCEHDNHDHNTPAGALVNGNGHSHPNSNSHSHCHSPESPTFPVRGHARSHSVAHNTHTFSQSQSAPQLGMNGHNTRQHSHQAPPALQLVQNIATRHGHASPEGPYASVPPKTPADLEGIFSPVTPSYQFGVDEHFAAHAPVHTPNLHDHSHVHSHGHHGHHGHSDNMRGVFLHVMADTLGSVGVIISTLLIQFYGWTGFDPIASLFIAILIAASVVPLIIDTGKVLALDITHRSSDIEHALAELSSIAGLVSYTSPQFWPKDSESIIGSIHVQLSKATGLDRVVEHVDNLLREKISGLEELTIQVEVLDLHDHGQDS